MQKPKPGGERSPSCLASCVVDVVEMATPVRDPRMDQDGLPPFTRRVRKSGVIPNVASFRHQRAQPSDGAKQVPANGRLAQPGQGARFLRRVPLIVAQYEDQSLTCGYSRHGAADFPPAFWRQDLILKGGQIVGDTIRKTRLPRRGCSRRQPPHVGRSGLEPVQTTVDQIRFSQSSNGSSSGNEARYAYASTKAS